MSSYRDIVLGIKSDKSTVGMVTNLDYKDKECLVVLVTNLLCCVSGNDILLYSRNKERADEWKNNPKGISNYRIMQAADWLEDNGYCFNTKASAYQLYEEVRKTSYLMVTEKFVDYFHTEELEVIAKQSAINTMQVISLRSDKGKEIIYRNNKEVAFKELAMRSMNNNNSQFDVVDESGNIVNTLYARVYKEDWSLNGRMYSAGVMSVENRESKGRLKFTIEQQDVVEIDYNAIHCRMFADINHTTLPSGDLYYNILPVDKHTKANRSVIKGSVNRMLNCDSHQSATATVRKCLSETEGHTLGSPSEVVQMIYSYLGSLKDKLYTNRLGLRLANIESDIMADVIAVFVALGKPILPIHDSAIVLREDKTLLAQTMADCYRKHLKVDRLVEMKYNVWIDDKEFKEDCSF